MTRFTLHVPGALNDGTPVGPEALDEIERRLLDIAGGFTLTLGVGVWRDPDDGKVYRDNVRLYASDTDESKREAFRDTADAIALALDQVAAYVTELPVQAALVYPSLVS